jgi:DNA repair protein RecN (Recombination protein N)
MLKQLSIHDFTLIAECTIHFGPGFSAITGETGAGKSVLMKALRVACGDKTTATMIRNDAEKAWVEATFEISNNPAIKKLLESLEIDADEELVIHRDILSGGKSRCRINGTLVTQNDLQTLGDALVQMHGQSDQLLLRDVHTQQQMLDNFCGNTETLAEYGDSWILWNKLKTKRATTEENAQTLSEQKEFLTFQFEELTKANLKVGEEEELEEKTAAAARGETQQRFLTELRQIMDGENGLMNQFQMFQGKTRQLAAKISEYEEWNQKITEIIDPLKEIEYSLRKAESHSIINPAEIDKANGRLALIQRLKRKYRTEVPGLIELRDRRQVELASLDNLDADLEELERQIKKAEGELIRLASTLSKSRKEGAGELDAAVEKHLHELGMPKARFKTALDTGELSPTGFDKIEFRIAPNPGEGDKSLRLAVSGGELSRVLLAFKSVMADLDKIPLLVFDEVDSGISGEIGNKIGDALRQIGKYHQVLTITHLHQVASRATGHLAVKKSEIEGRTYSTVQSLSPEERILELSRMLGDAKSVTVQAHAKELLEENHAS